MLFDVIQWAEYLVIFSIFYKFIFNVIICSSTFFVHVFVFVFDALILFHKYGTK